MVVQQLFLFGLAIVPPDQVTVGLVLMVLAFTSTLAGLIPTVRAMRINPITALRE
jgi:ABC-type lipoprotein release transport system permease subunit